MPSKSRRIASRQSQLKRKRRGKSKTQQFDSGPTESILEEDASPDSNYARVTESNTKTNSLNNSDNETRSSRRNIASTVPLTYNYLGSELKNIGVITCMIAVAFVVLVLVLN